MRVRLMIMFDIVPGKEKEYDDFLLDCGLPFWRGREGLCGMQSFRTAVGPGPAVVAEVDFESPEAAFATLFSDEYVRLKKQQAQFVVGLQSRLLLPAEALAGVQGGVHGIEHR